MAKDEPVEVDFDSDKAERLLGILHDLKDATAWPYIKEAATSELAKMNHELWEQLHPEEVEAEKARQEELEKQAEEAKKQREEEKKQREEERKREEEKAA